jgi:hypothetical protein
MSITKTLLASVAGTLLAGAAMAAEPTTLTDAQMDDVAAGLTLVGAIGLIGPFDALNFSGLQFTDLSQTATTDQVAVTATGAQSLFQTQSAAGLTGIVTSLNNGGVFLSGGSIAVGFSLTTP